MRERGDVEGRRRWWRGREDKLPFLLLAKLFALLQDLLLLLLELLLLTTKLLLPKLLLSNLLPLALLLLANLGFLTKALLLQSLLLLLPKLLVLPEVLELERFLLSLLSLPKELLLVLKRTCRRQVRLQGRSRVRWPGVGGGKRSVARQRLGEARSGEGRGGDVG